MIKAFLLMLSFFTRIPLGNCVEYTDERYKRSLITFPLVGLVIGAFLALPSFIPHISGQLKALLSIFVYIGITGGIHLDGLADSCDGIFSNRNKDRVLEIMKDSHIGTFGVIALILYFIAFYTSACVLDWKWLLLTPVVGKTMAFFTAGFSVYARPDNGMGTIFIETITPIKAVISVILLLSVTGFVLGFEGIIGVMVALIVAWMIFRKTWKVIQGQTGDTIGMIVEVCQIAFMLAGAILKTI